jgi:ribose transport system ATP-binding protein
MPNEIENTIPAGVIRTDHIVKRFGGTLALNDISVSVLPETVHAVTGENGAGKSTLMKIFAGVYKADEGHMFIQGEKTDFSSTRAARNAGISTVFQELSLIPNLTVAENLFLGRERSHFGGKLNKKQMEEQSHGLLSELGLSLSPRKIVSSLPIAEQQLVEIAKGISEDSEVFIFDEPTAILGKEEARKIATLIRSLKSKGKTVLYISHRLEEIFDFCDRVTVLKDGAHVATYDISDLNMDSLVHLMIGRELVNMYPPRREPSKEASLVVEALQLQEGAKENTFEVRRGEMLGLAGLEGHGAQSAIKALSGVLKVPVCRIKKVTPNKRSVDIPIKRGISSVVQHDIGYMTDDRKKEGLYLELSVETNISLGKVQRLPLWVIIPKMDEAVKDIIKDMTIAAASPSQKVGSLSGGNQQKVMLGRWFFAETNVLLINDPTRGVDVGSRAEVYRLLRRFCDDGGCVVFASRDMPELIGLADRILVFHNNQVVQELNPQEADEEMILAHAVGMKLDPARRWGSAEMADGETGRFGIDGLQHVVGSKIIPAGRYKKKGPWRIGHAFNGLTNSWRIQIAEEMKHAASLIAQIKEYIFFEANDDPKRQSAQFQKLLEQDVDALILSAAAMENCNDLISRAVSTGIPVISLVEPIRSKEVTVLIDGDQFYYGYEAGKWLVNQLQAKGNVWMLKGIPDFPASVTRDKGAYAAFNETELIVTGEGHGYWQLGKSRQLVKELLKSAPHPDGVWSAGAAMSRATIEVFEEKGLNVPPIVGETENGFIRLWKKNNLNAMALTNLPTSLGIASIRAAIALLKGEQVHGEYLHRPKPIITPEERDKLFRPDLPDDAWLPTSAPEALLHKLYGT